MNASGSVAQAVRDFASALSAGEVDRFEDLVAVSQDTLVIGTAPGEWVTDPAALRFGFETEGVRLTPTSKLTAAAGGDLAWAADEPTFAFPDGSTIDTRATFVLVREDERWKIIHMHVSVGVPDDEVAALQRRWHGSTQGEGTL